MARFGCNAQNSKNPVATTGLYRGGETTITAVTTTAIEIPATTLSYRKGITVQNLDSTNAVYLWVSLPELIYNAVDNSTMVSDCIARTDLRATYDVRWKLSGFGTNEWYAVSSAGSGTPSITQPVRIYYTTTGVTGETLGTAGTAGSIAAEHGWAWGNTDTLGYNTLYVRTGGSTPAYNPSKVYTYFLSYTTVPTTTTGYQLAKGTAYYLELDGSCRLWCIASTGTINVATIEHR